MFYTYILQLKDGSCYAGYSADLKTRIKAHKQGSINSTKNLRPLKLIFYCAFESQKLATDFEKYLKTPSGFAFRNKHLI
ncbi:MAG: excinuclease ABC subunit C [uncultured bacterium]|nr:MAG: excinuclease ABC subunit C [uncultured bacterium]